MLDSYSVADDSPRRTFVNVDAELDTLDFEDEMPLGSEDLNYALADSPEALCFFSRYIR